MSTEDQRKKWREYKRKYYKTEKGKASQKRNGQNYRKKYPDRRKPPNRLRASQSYRAIIMDYLIKRDGFQCGICKLSLENSQIHFNHIVPLALGGQEIMENLELSHAKCNLAQSTAIRKEKYGH